MLKVKEGHSGHRCLLCGLTGTSLTLEAPGLGYWANDDGMPDDAEVAICTPCREDLKVVL